MNTLIQTDVPPTLVEALESYDRAGKVRRYSSLRAVYHCLRVDVNFWIGVAGDGDNGAYEWFAFNNGVLECSNAGYGGTLVALREALVLFVE